MVWFTGTATGNKYTVGQSYSMAGDTYTAQSDGTFRNERTGRSTVGSSQSPNVQWGGGASLGSDGRSSGTGKSGRSVSTAPSPRTPRTGPGPGPVTGIPVPRPRPPTAGAGSAAVVVVGKPGVPGVVKGSPVGVAGAGAPQRIYRTWGSGLRIAVDGDLPIPFKAPDEVPRIYIGGVRVPYDEGTSSGQNREDAYGDTEFGNPAWFLDWAAAGAHFGPPVAATVRSEVQQSPLRYFPQDERDRFGEPLNREPTVNEVLRDALARDALDRVPM